MHIKKILSLLLAAALCLALLPPVHAAGGEAADAANALYALGLFRGVGTDENGRPDFDLDRTPARTEGVTMLVRLLGAEDAAKSRDRNTPFTDVPDWAAPYVGYAYENGLTNGTGDTAFGSGLSVSAAQYLTLILRALGYEDGDGRDFLWSEPWVLTDRLGITRGEYDAGTENFTRGDVAILSCRALSAKVKGRDYTLRDTLTISAYTGVSTAFSLLTSALEALSDAAGQENAPLVFSSAGMVKESYESVLGQLDRMLLLGAEHKELAAAVAALRSHFASLPPMSDDPDGFLAWLEAISRDAFIDRTAELGAAVDGEMLRAFPGLAGQTGG